MMAKRQTEEEKQLSRIVNLEQQVAQAQSTIVRVVYEFATMNQQMLGRVVTLLEGEQELRKREMSVREAESQLEYETAKRRQEHQEKLLVLMDPILKAWVPMFVNKLDKLFNANATLRTMGDRLKAKLPLDMAFAVMSSMTHDQIEDLSKALFKAQVAGMDRKTLLAAHSGDVHALVAVVEFVRSMPDGVIEILLPHLTPAQVVVFTELHSVISESEQKKAADAPEPSPSPG